MVAFVAAGRSSFRCKHCHESPVPNSAQAKTLPRLGTWDAVGKYEPLSSKALNIRSFLSVPLSSGLESTTHPHAVNKDIYWASDLLNSSSGFVCSYESDGLAARQHTVT